MTMQCARLFLVIILFAALVPGSAAAMACCDGEAEQPAFTENCHEIPSDLAPAPPHSQMQSCDCTAVLQWVEPSLTVRPFSPEKPVPGKIASRQSMARHPNTPPPKPPVVLR